MMPTQRAAFVAAIILSGCATTAEVPVAEAPKVEARVNCENLTDTEVMKLLEREQTDAATARSKICIEPEKVAP